MVMKKILIAFLCTAAAMLLCATAAFADLMLLEYDGDVHEYDGAVYALVVNNHEITPPLSPIIFNDRALVPVREIFEEVGAEVQYDAESQAVRIYNEDTTVLLYINDNIAYINGQKVAIPDNVVPKLISKLGGETKTMVPVRFISESIGMPVDFDADAGAILIASNSYDYSIPAEETKPKTYVTDMSYKVTGNNQFTVTLTADNLIENVDNFTMNSPGRLVVDLNGAGLAIDSGTTAVNKLGINSIRLGDNGERARIVIDSEYIRSYNINMLSESRIAVVINTNAPAPSAPPAETPKPANTPAPVTNSKTEINPAYKPYPNATKMVILDAGHGGTDSGAIGNLNGSSVLEKDLTLSITYKVKKILEDNGVTVSMTRTLDTLPSLVERPTQANSENAALFVSIHINSADAVEAKGIETFYSLENNEMTYGTSSEILATSLLKHMISETNAVKRSVQTANHAVTRRCNMPASLVECGFISNADEVAKMASEDYQGKLARGIADGILETLPKVTIPAK